MSSSASTNETEVETTFAPVEELLDEIKRGRMIVLVDDENRENEGDLCMAAEAATPETINFMARFGRGLICLALDKATCDRLSLHPQSEKNTTSFGTRSEERRVEK